MTSTTRLVRRGSCVNELAGRAGKGTFGAVLGAGAAGTIMRLACEGRYSARV